MSAANIGSQNQLLCIFCIFDKRAGLSFPSVPSCFDDSRRVKMSSRLSVRCPAVTHAAGSSDTLRLALRLTGVGKTVAAAANSRCFSFKLTPNRPPLFTLETDRSFCRFLFLNKLGQTASSTTNFTNLLLF